MFFFNFSFIIIYFEFSLNNQLSIFIFEIFLWWYFDQSDSGFFCLAFENSVFLKFFKFQDTIFELFIFLVFPSTLKNFRFFLSFFFFFQISICFFHISSNSSLLDSLSTLSIKRLSFLNSLISCNLKFFLFWQGSSPTSCETAQVFY